MTIIIDTTSTVGHSFSLTHPHIDSWASSTIRPSDWRNGKKTLKNDVRSYPLTHTHNTRISNSLSDINFLIHPLSVCSLIASENATGCYYGDQTYVVIGLQFDDNGFYQSSALFHSMAVQQSRKVHSMIAITPVKKKRKKIRKKSSIFWWRSRWRHHTTDIYCEYVYNQFREWRVDEWGGCIRFHNWRLAMNECMHIAQKSEKESKIVDMRNHDAICSIHMHLYLVKYERRPLRRVVALKRQFMQCTCNFIATNRECIETWDTVFFPFHIFLRSLILFFFQFYFFTLLALVET